MQGYGTLVKRELGGFFYSLTGYVVIAAVLFLLGLSFFNLIVALNNDPTDQPVTELFFNTMYFWFILLLAAPVMTMRSFAQEKASGTYETLMTTRVSDLVVVLAKFSGAWLFYMVTWSPLLLCLLIVRHYSNDPTVLDAGTLGATFLGIGLLGAVFMSIGCFASSVTRNQIIAAMLSLVGGISFFLLSFISQAVTAKTGWRTDLFNYLEVIRHMEDFAAGVVDTRPVVLYASLTLLFLFLTLRVVESRRWK